ncbi:hypothetical protein L596_010001 [Steinernema carpocapsae]|uniref:Ig-like domain-containing protein n=1 Tax=Steinernema carpocapsae TaxID=34508 RepID=A0A4U5PH08_STECR|nr:hypothetical protein L596_010001 [Steinernema carpocapsae]
MLSVKYKRITIHMDCDSEAKEKAIGRCPPEFVELLRSASSNVGGTAVLKCKVKGDPRPKLKWTKDGKEIEMSARITTTYAEDGSIELKVENVTKNEGALPTEDKHITMLRIGKVRSLLSILRKQFFFDSGCRKFVSSGPTSWVVGLKTWVSS